MVRYHFTALTVTLVYSDASAFLGVNPSYFCKCILFAKCLARLYGSGVEIHSGHRFMLLSAVGIRPCVCAGKPQPRTFILQTD